MISKIWKANLGNKEVQFISMTKKLVNNLWITWDTKLMSGGDLEIKMGREWCWACDFRTSDDGCEVVWWWEW